LSVDVLVADVKRCRESVCIRCSDRCS